MRVARARWRDQVREGVRIPGALLHRGHQRASRGVADAGHQHRHGAEPREHQKKGDGERREKGNVDGHGAPARLV